MTDLIQYLIVGAIVLAALIYTIKRFRSSASAGKGGACGCGCGGCPEPSKPAAEFSGNGCPIDKKGK